MKNNDYTNISVKVSFLESGAKRIDQFTTSLSKRLPLKSSAFLTGRSGSREKLTGEWVSVPEQVFSRCEAHSQ